MNNITQGPISDVRERDVRAGAMRKSLRSLLRLTLGHFAGLDRAGLIPSEKCVPMRGLIDVGMVAPDPGNHWEIAAAVVTAMPYQPRELHPRSRLRSL
jgi:hypothetical protein